MDAMKRCSGCAEEIRMEASRCARCGIRVERLHRGVEGRAVAGVCAMLARELGIDVALVRVAVVVATLFSGGTLPLVYVLLWAFTPASALGRAPLQRTLNWLSRFGESEAPRLERRV
ncbi:phage shock protein C (PspC) family protein [Myxococcus fulvus]|uniref:Phage shock protein C (PspC) family protein n=2 Tax=Myxococcus fulvus TaxID=33 RepID=A0ABY1CEH9_MYXFU|nr:PspC domain-containing protein [Myxococcus fulvus]SET97570.1 phage shock protein C (PspC) family protein [Myxococcus fulvus]